MTPGYRLSGLLPLAVAHDLAQAAGLAHPGQRMAEINRITDKLAAAGLCRPRADTSRLGEWIAQRPLPKEQ